MSTTFELACVGDRVWSVNKGWGVVRNITKSRTFPIRVSYPEDITEFYTEDGLLYLDDLHPTLFWDEIVFEVPKKPLPKLEVDTKVLVWDVDKPKNKLVRYFCSFDASGRVVVFQHGTTSFSCEGYTEIWSEWEVYKEHESE